MWRLLLHYRSGPFGLESEASSPNFFLSPYGRRNPESEMEADIQAMLGPNTPEQEKILCRFPARYAWLVKKLGINPPELNCPAFNDWKKKMEAPSVSLVFASAYLGNPAALYGHTFLRFNKNDANNSSRLLDPTINFAARAQTQNEILFAIDGLLGVFPGNYSAMPYYLKVQEYNDFQNRDLWEYRLNLDSSAITRLLPHLWEIDKVNFPYYFFNKNCSYQLLSLIEVANPHVHLMDSWPLYVIPADTIRAVKDAGLVKSETYRPSLFTQILYELQKLNPTEAKIIPSFLKSPTMALAQAKILPQKREAIVLDLAGKYLQYQADYRQKKEKLLEGTKYQILSARAALGIPSPIEKIPVPAPPESGHASSRFSIGESAGSSNFTEFNWRPALHDILDPPAGYNPDSELAMVNLDMRRDLRTGRSYLHDLDLMKILSLSPINSVLEKPSWNIDWGLKTADELRPKDPWNANYAGLRLGSGASFKMPLVPWRQTTYALLDTDAGSGQVFRNSYRLGGGARVGTVADLTPHWRVTLEGSAFGYFLGDTRPDIGARLESQTDLTKSLALRLKAERYGPEKQAGVNLLFYY